MKLREHREAARQAALAFFAIKRLIRQTRAQKLLLAQRPTLTVRA